MTLNPKQRPYTYRRHLMYALLTLLFHFFFYSVIAQPTASFSSDKEGGCPPFSVQFTNYTTGVSASATYRWDFGNGNTSDLKDAASIYTEDKTYKVTLTVTDAGKTSTYSKEITGYKKPVADFSVSTNKACIPAVINFTSSSKPGSGDVTRFYWDFGDGTTQEAGEVASHTYMFLQKPSVTLTVTNTYGCNNSVTKDKIAEILPSIQSSFTSDKQVLCKTTDAVQFTNTSSGPGTLSYTWDFGDGHTSTVKEPSYSFNKKGIYTVSLTVKNTDGCSVTNTQSDYLNVASYKAGFDAPPLICKDVQVNFTRTSSPIPTSTVWYVDGQPVNYWDGYLSMPFNVIGDHDIKIDNTFGTCTDTYSTKVNVKPIPEMSEFTADVQANCGPPAVVKFKDNTPGAVKWEWNFNWNNYNDNFTSFVQAPSFTYSSEGYYATLLKVTNVHGCSNAIAQYVYITKPFANFNNILSIDETSYRCGYLKVKLAVTDSSEEITAYKWYLGDGTTSTEKQPVKEYTQPGNYHVYLEFTTKSGCKGTSNSADFSVYKKPKADFAAYPGTNICGNTPVSYSYTGGSTITNASWAFEGDFNYTNNSQIIQYNTEGVYGVSLIVFNGNCSDTINKPNYITIAPPFPRITGYEPTCEGTRGKVKFTQSSKGAMSWKWDFGDGSTKLFTVDEPVVEHEYTKTGSYKVVLITTNGLCTVRDSMYINILLKQKPMLTLLKTDFCGNESIPFTISNYEKNPAYTSGDQYYFQQWEYTDGTSFNGYASLNFNTYWTTNAKGTLNPGVIKDGQLRFISYSSVFGCQDTSNAVAIKLKGAAAAFDIVKDKQCFASPVVLKDASIVNNNNITNWKWDFGDGQSQSLTQGSDVSHVYDNPGQYNVQLTITDAGGCSSTSPPYSKTVEAYGPKAAFGVSGTNVPLNTTVQFYNYTNVYGSDNAQYTWNFGDGTSGNNYNEQHTYTQPGTYIVKLTAKDAVTGCTSQAPEQTIVVRYFNSAFQYNTSFVTSTNCAPVLAQFTNTSYDYTRIIWDFGDGYMLEDVNYAGHVYKTPGTYVVTLFVYGYNGLKGQYTDTILINQPAASLKVNPDALCKGQSAHLLASGKKISNYAWDFGDGNVQLSGDSTISHVYNSTGTFTPQLLITDENGCTAAGNAGDKLTVRPEPVVTITPANPRVCEGQSLQLKASGGVTYTWQVANGITDLTVPNPIVKPGITTTYSVQIKDDLGCTANGEQTVNVVQHQQLSVTDDKGICYGSEVKLTASGTTQYKWIGATEGLSSTTIPDPVAKPQATIMYTVTGGDEYGCFVDTAAVKVSVYPLPTVNAGNDVESLAGTILQLNATGSANITNWLWTPDKYLDCRTCASTVAKPLATTEYTITAKTAYGCTASDAVVLKMLCEANKVFIPTAFTPDNDGKNDYFMIKGIGIVKHLIIYDRRGYKVFEKNNFIASDRSSAWDGTLKGQQLPTATFVYFAEMECPDGGTFTRKGTVTLIR